TGATKQDNLIFRARLHDGGASSLDALLPGSELEVTGLVELEFAATEGDNEGPRTAPVNFGLILRGESDVTVIQQPSWWTTEHFFAVLSAVLLALGGALLWNLQLKSQVRRKSVLLSQEINARRDAVMEFRATMRERNRLAANLHDTLPQSMSGIGLQLDACEISLRNLGIETLPPLDVARRMVEYAVGELRGAVWEMRSLSLRGRSFTAALQAVVDQAASGYSTRVTVHTEGPLERIPDVVSGNLLLIVQEALRNALQHGKPENIYLTITTEAQHAPIRLECRDDGPGFTPGSQNGPEQGHYGIVGMRERAERLAGSLKVESSPGHGTRLIAVVDQVLNNEDPEDGISLAESS
ncbi:MAG: sensor histidine kinase, partial [Luteolibacter sp.]